MVDKNSQVDVGATMSAISPGGNWAVLRVAQIWTAHKSSATRGSVEEPVGMHEGGVVFELPEDGEMLVSIRINPFDPEHQEAAAPEGTMDEQDFRLLLQRIQSLTENIAK